MKHFDGRAAYVRVHSERASSRIFVLSDSWNFLTYDILRLWRLASARAT